MMRLIALMLAALLALSGCAAPTPSADIPEGEVTGAVAVLDLPYGSTPFVAEAAAASERLGWQALQAGDEPNRVVSPSSLAMSLGQAAEGAEGASLESIDAALGLTGDERARSFGALRQSLLPYDSLPDEVDADAPPESPVVHQASRVLAIDAELKQPFLDRIVEFYDASAEQVTLADAKPNLDAWANRHTAGLIPKSAIEPNDSTVAVLQDALLFAAAWAAEFQLERPLDFHTPSGAQRVDAVWGTFSISFARAERWSAVRLPYDEHLAADVILPAEGLQPSDLTVDDLTAARKALDGAAAQLVAVSMPTFDLTAQTDLMKDLPEIDLANLNGIVDGGSASAWVQQTKLIVTAKGTVGAALTEMVVATSGGAGPEPIEFRVDRPYVFRVLDTRTGWPLFLAAVSDPGAES